MTKLKNWILGFNVPSLLKRSAIMPFVTAMTSFGIACYYTCGLGTDPISVFVDGQHYLLEMSYGQITNINNVILLALMLILCRKYVGIGTVVSTLLAGTFIDLFSGALMTAFPKETTALWIRAVILAVGVFVFAFGTGLFIKLNIGVGCFDFFGLFICDRVPKWDLKYVRIVLDALFTVAGLVMGAVAGVGVFEMIGIGTVAGVLLTGPILTFGMKVMSKPIDTFCGPLRKDELSEEVSEG